MKRQSAQLLQIGCDQGQVGWHSSWQRRYCNSRRAHGPLRPTWKRRFRWWKKNVTTVFLLSNKKELWEMQRIRISKCLMRLPYLKKCQLRTLPTSQVGCKITRLDPQTPKIVWPLRRWSQHPTIPTRTEATWVAGLIPAAPRAFLSQLFIAKPQTT